jgi:WhiB family redox-sensing transcriptional regulator
MTVNTCPETCTRCDVQLYPNRAPVERRPVGARRHAARGLCNPCYDKVRRTGELLPAPVLQGRPTTMRPATGADEFGGWRLRALCRAEGQVDWFDVDTASDPRAARAQRVCRDCPVRLACLTDALRVETPSTRFGIRGGLTPADRNRLARNIQEQQS